MKCQLLLLTHKERYDGFSITSLCTFSMFSGLVLVVGRPDRGSSSKLSLPRWNSFTHRLIVEEEGEDCP